MITVAEQSGLIVDLGEWILERACRDHGRWADSHPEVVLDLAVNVSARQLVSPDYVGSLARVLHRTAMDPHRLVLEITETVFLEDSELVTTVVAGIVALGIRLALDDFGTGYASLSYLRRLPITYVKIDQSFTTDIDDTPLGSTLIAAVTDLAHTLNLQVIVEGIETAHHHNEIATLGCDYAQGYLYAHPLPATDITTMLTTSAHTTDITSREVS
jgi:EAL domain-containing protein (putative c-di-GMP-specific phosphodiesterase class I)